jgi:hypothetical protein
LKEWERNIFEGRQQAKEIRRSCEETFSLLNGIWLGSDGESSIEILGSEQYSQISAKYQRK